MWSPSTPPAVPDVQRWTGVRTRWQTSLRRCVDDFKARGLNPTRHSFDSPVWTVCGLSVPLFCTTGSFTPLTQIPPLAAELAYYLKYHFIIALVEVLRRSQILWKKCQF